MNNRENIYQNFLKILDKNHIYYEKDDDLTSDSEVVVDSYITHGVGGRSCWNEEGDNGYTIYGESPSYENIYKVFNLFFGEDENLYDKMIDSNNISIGEKEVSDVPDYYGNYTDKCFLFLKLRDFF
jgi:hypothetical protein